MLLCALIFTGRKPFPKSSKPNIAFTNIIKTRAKSLFTKSSKPASHPQECATRIPYKVFGQAFFKKLAGCGAAPHGFALPYLGQAFFKKLAGFGAAPHDLGFDLIFNLVLPPSKKG